MEIVLIMDEAVGLTAECAELGPGIGPAVTALESRGAVDISISFVIMRGEVRGGDCWRWRWRRKLMRSMDREEIKEDG